MEPSQQAMTEAQAKLDDILKQTREGVNTITALRQELEGYQKEAQDACAHKESVERSVEEEQARLGTIKTAIEKANEELNALSVSLDDARATLLVTHGDIQESKKAHDAILSDTQKRYDKIVTEHVARVDALLVEYGTLNDKKIDLSRSIDSLKEQEKTFRDALHVIEEKSDSVEKEIEASELILERMNAEKAALAGDIQGIKEDKASLADTLATLRESVIATTTERDTLKAQCEALSVELAKNNTVNNDFLTTRAGVIKQMQEVQQREDYLRGKYAALGETW